MHRHPAALSTVLLVAAASAQSPLTTLFAGNNTAGSNTAVYFDLTVSASLAVTRLDVNLSSTANAVGVVDFYTAPGSWVGNDTNPSAWTRMGGGPVTAAGVNLPSIVAMAQPFALAPGSYGIAVVYSGGVGPEYTNGTGSNQNFSNAELAIRCGASGGVFSGAVNNPRVWNGAIHYGQGANLASFRTYGSGCYDLPVSFYELFAASAFDLGGSPTHSIVLQPNGMGGYVVSAGSSAFFTPASPDLLLGDDDVSVAQAMPFSLTGPGFSTNTVYVGSNGRLWFSNQYDTLYAPSLSALLGAGPSLCPLWTDLDPTTAGSVHAETDPVSGRFYVTWLGVPQYGDPARTNTFQVAIAASGSIEIAWQGIATQNAVLVGSSQGAGAADPGGRDLSLLPFDTGPAAAPLHLVATARPVLGQGFDLATANTPPNAVLGVQELGFAQFDPGIDLAPIGMPGCRQFASLDLPLLLLPGAGRMAVHVVVPNNPALSGLHLFAQSFALASGFNALGLVAANGVDLGLGR